MLGKLVRERVHVSSRSEQLDWWFSKSLGVVGLGGIE